MLSRSSAFVLGLCLLAPACAGDRDAHATTSSPPEAATETPSGATEHAFEDREDERPSIALTAGLHQAPMTEVSLDPSGRSALTLDAEGGVRLWPDLQADNVAAPLLLPVHEPVWMSLARTGSGFVAGFIDTAGGAQVGRIEVTKGRARWIPTFEIPSTDPLFELHVLDGGKRILGLAVDHRIHLWETDGDIVARLDESGFVPWQLRVAQAPGGEPTVVAVLAGPVRVQEISMKGDRLALAGPAHAVAIDQGPNRSDITLTPDGKTVLALQHPHRRDPRFELELIDLRSGKRRILAAESDAAMRPRVHPWEGQRVLLESGSGKAFWIAFEDATAWPPVEGDPDRTKLPLTAITPFDLPGSTRASRFHADAVAGQRVVPTPEGLVVSRPEEKGFRRLGRESFRPTAVALDARGERIAWGTEEVVVLESVGRTGEMQGIPSPTGGIELLAFLGDAHLVTMAPSGEASVRRLSDGKVVSTEKIAFAWGIANTAWRRSEVGGDIVLASIRPSEPVHVLGVSGTDFAQVRDVAGAERAQWPEGGKPRHMESRDWLGEIGLDDGNLDLRPGEVLRTEPDPTGRRIALAQKARHVEGFDEIEGEWVVGPHEFVVSVYDRETRERLWTLSAPALTDLAWSGDGHRLAVTHGDIGLVLDARTGTTLHERHDLGLTITDTRDPGARRR